MTGILTLSKIQTDLNSLSKEIIRIFELITNTIIINIIEIIMVDELSECVLKLF